MNTTNPGLLIITGYCFLPNQPILRIVLQSWSSDQCNDAMFTVNDNLGFCLILVEKTIAKRVSIN